MAKTTLPYIDNISLPYDAESKISLSTDGKLTKVNTAQIAYFDTFLH